MCVIKGRCSHLAFQPSKVQRQLCNVEGVTLPHMNLLGKKYKHLYEGKEIAKGGEEIRHV